MDKDNRNSIDFDPKTMGWFRDNIGEPTPFQREVWGRIKKEENVVLISPTGSGKTMAATLPAVDDIVRGRVTRKNTSILYISPMKAMGADLVKTLREMSESIGPIPGKKIRKRGRKRTGEQPDSPIDIGIRTGDVPQSQRRRMLVHPPDLLITTPENLLLMLCSKARSILKNIRYLIIDEVHEMISGKRGALLSLGLEYLEEIIASENNPPPIRIGLSATVRPPSRAAGYVAGLSDDGRRRRISTVREEERKRIDVEIRTLTEELEREDVIQDKITDDVGSLISESEGSMVVFHNTRTMAERMAYSLIQNGHESVRPHHGSLGVDVRREAEEGLKRGDLKCIVSSTSLELGIDIGTVNTVLQISSPKDPGSLMQRFGRSGHRLGEVSHGIIYPLDGPDLLESYAVSRAAAKGNLERLKPPDGPLDVLAQFAIGMSLEGNGLHVDDLFRISCRAYPYKGLRKYKVEKILSLLSKRLPGGSQPPPRLWREEESGLFYPRRNTRQAFYLNCGTIPKETNYRVIDESEKRKIGDLSRDFGETLYEGDVILLGSRTYRIRSFSGSSIIVREDKEASPSVPSWSGEVKPRPGTVSKDIYETYSRRGAIRLGSGRGMRLEVDNRGRYLLRELIEKQEEAGVKPAEDRLPVEYVVKSRGRHVYIFHLPLGRKVTDPIGRVLSYGIRRMIGARIDYVSTDDGFAIASPCGLEKEMLIDSLNPEEFESTARRLILSSSMFKTRFSHCLNKSLLVLARFRGKETSAVYRRRRVESLLKLLNKTYLSDNEPAQTDPLSGLLLLGDEAMNEVKSEKVNLSKSLEVVKSLQKGKMSMEITEPMKETSIMGSNIIRSWRTLDEVYLKRKKDIEAVEVESKILGEIDETGAFAGSDKTGLSTVIDLLSGRDTNGISSKSLAKKTGRGLSEIEEGIRIKSSRGEVIGISTKKGRIMIPLQEGIDIPQLPFKMESIIYRRFKGKIEGGMKNVLGSLPFFTHPLELITRNRSIEIDHIRSAVKGGRIIPFRAGGEPRQGDPDWANVFIQLSMDPPEVSDRLLELIKLNAPLERSEIADATGMKGDYLKDLIDELIRTNVLARYSWEVISDLGADGGYFPISDASRFFTGDRSFQQIWSLESFLSNLGPFTLGELSVIFGWEDGWYPPGLIKGLEFGKFKLGIGPIGPMESGEADERSFWIWLDSVEEEQPNGNDITSEGINLVSPSSDMSLYLIGKKQRWIESEHVRGAVSRRIILHSGKRTEGVANVLEMTDLIRISDLEISEFENMGSCTRDILNGLEGYTRMDHFAFVVEKIMGIPAGEAASSSVDVFKEAGFRIEETSKGRMLVRGVRLEDDIQREDMVLLMLKKQHMLDGYHYSHPLEVVNGLTSIIDRWEVLSRLGSERHKRLAGVPVKEFERRQKAHMMSILKEIKGGKPSDGLDISDLLSKGTERLSDLKDISKRFSLYRTVMDQNTPVWTTRVILEFYPPPTRGEMRSVTEVEWSILKRIAHGELAESDLTSKRGDIGRIIKDLVNNRMIVEDPWNGKKAIFNDGRYSKIKGKGGRREHTRGLLQRGWILKAARNLGIFKIMDLMNYSPEIGDRCKIRRILGELSQDNIDRFLTVGAGINIIYSATDNDPTSEIKELEKRARDSLVILSPKDRMSKVLEHDKKRLSSRSHGFSVFRSGKPIAILSLKKSTGKIRHTDFGMGGQRSSSPDNLLVNRAWFDLRYGREDLFREIRKKFFDLGFSLLSEEEKKNVENLYRDIDTRNLD